MSKDNNNPHKLSPKRKKILWGLVAFFLLLGILYGIYWILWGHFRESTDDAYVDGNQVQLMSQVSGTVIAIYTDDTRVAKQGQQLVRLDNTDMLVALQNARANLAQTVRQVRTYYENVSEIQATLTQREADLIQAQKDLRRRQGLVGPGAISSEEMHHYTTTLEAAQAQYDQTLYQLTAAKALVENSQLYHHPLVEQAKTKFKRAYLNWVRTAIYSPANGYVAKRNVQVGQQITPGTALMAVVPLDQIWVNANFKETQLSRLRVGQSATVKADANGVTYHGHIVGFSPGSGNAFALLPPQNATGNWIKIVQRLPVRIVLDSKELRKHPLALGLSMNVTAHTRGLKGKLLSTQSTNRSPLYSTWIFNDQLRHANQEIAEILRANSPNIRLDAPIKKQPPELANG